MELLHTVAPVYDAHSEILILGSFPSVKSREAKFFYGHSQNRFWKVVSAVFGSPEPLTIPEKKAFLLENHIALWDVVAACTIEGSADSTLRLLKPNDIGVILSAAAIQQIFINGQTPKKLYDKVIFPAVGRQAICLPSTSPANASFSLEKLIDAWRVIAERE